MKSKIQIAALFAAFLFGTAGASVCAAQEDVIVGGYGDATVTDPQVVKAANFAVTAQKKKSLKLVSVLKAEQQVVAGMNFRMCLSLSSAGKPEQATATVYQNLQNKYSLSEWKAGKCEAEKFGEINELTPPDLIVKRLYAAEENEENPFFQSEDRARIDRFFSKDFADLIWNDAVTANGEVGALDFDPLYNAQDITITNFAIGKPQTDSASGITTVLVTFKNFRKPVTIKFLFERDDSKIWKITNVVYEEGFTLKGLYTTALVDSNDSRQN